MDPHLQSPGRRDSEENRGDEDAVQSEVAGHSALDAKGPGLAESDEEDGGDDEDQGRDGAGLSAEIVGGEALDGNAVKGVVVQRSAPDGAEPEEGFFHLCGEVGEGAAGDVEVEDECAKCGGEKAGEGEGEEVGEGAAGWGVG